MAGTPTRLCSAHLECCRHDTWRAADSSSAALQNSQSAAARTKLTGILSPPGPAELATPPATVPCSVFAVQQMPSGPTCWAATVRCRCAARDLWSSASPLLLVSWDSACLRAPCTQGGDKPAKVPLAIQGNLCLCYIPHADSQQQRSLASASGCRALPSTATPQ